MNFYAFHTKHVEIDMQPLHFSYKHVGIVCNRYIFITVHLYTLTLYKPSRVPAFASVYIFLFHSKGMHLNMSKGVRTNRCDNSSENGWQNINSRQFDGRFKMKVCYSSIA